MKIDPMDASPMNRFYAIDTAQEAREIVHRLLEGQKLPEVTLWRLFDYFDHVEVRKQGAIRKVLAAYRESMERSIVERERKAWLDGAQYRLGCGFVKLVDGNEASGHGWHACIDELNRRYPSAKPNAVLTDAEIDALRTARCTPDGMSYDSPEHDRFVAREIEQAVLTKLAEAKNLGGQSPRHG